MSWITAESSKASKLQNLLDVLKMAFPTIHAFSVCAQTVVRVGPTSRNSTRFFYFPVPTPRPPLYISASASGYTCPHSALPSIVITGIVQMPPMSLGHVLPAETLPWGGF
jgi:hypothetical protein